MNGNDPLAAWRRNPFFILGVSPEASRVDVERAGQRLLALLEVGATSAQSYDTPLGKATRDADGVRQALAQLRDPDDRVVHELWARLGAVVPRERNDNQAGPWDEAVRAFGWTGPWAG